MLCHKCVTNTAIIYKSHEVSREQNFRVNKVSQFKKDQGPTKYIFLKELGETCEYFVEKRMFVNCSL